MSLTQKKIFRTPCGAPSVTVMVGNPGNNTVSMLLQALAGSCRDCHSPGALDRTVKHGLLADEMAGCEEVVFMSFFQENASIFKKEKENK